MDFFSYIMGKKHGGSGSASNGVKAYTVQRGRDVLYDIGGIEMAHVSDETPAMSELFNGLFIYITDLGLLGSYTTEGFDDLYNTGWVTEENGVYYYLGNGTPLLTVCPATVGLEISGMFISAVAPSGDPLDKVYFVYETE